MVAKNVIVTFKHAHIARLRLPFFQPLKGKLKGNTTDPDPCKKAQRGCFYKNSHPHTTLEKPAARQT